MDSSTLTQNLSEKEDLTGLSLKMFPAYSIATKELTSESFLKRWMNSGMVYRGEFLTLNTLEHHNEDVECILSQVMETCAPLESFLTIEQIQSLISRAEARGQTLHPKLEKAYRDQMSLLSNMQALDESTQQDHKPKDTETTGKHTHSTPEEAQTLYVRRMLPTEYEKLQGFPENWTQID